MKVLLDSHRCQGHARCAAFAPETFVFDDDGFSRVREGMEDVKPENAPGVRKACANCPELAISIIED
ncbi:ferredoxin [Rhodobacteraceae bacterium HSP-20]|uniref:Ferredoxin n=1 Tax=Paragemmobacter amnigenus TaxID=2852097 RepID=A0ABS6J5F2_9RHOB|nr:ferredoxin [Rhodobacter amnigenus]MBU9698979.1 ferredoxin [Rhodobacter amnigenus]MBV4390206.1 ferredoxin [Rhodobacter amnigenus]